jgi:hypothetical protein
MARQLPPQPQPARPIKFTCPHCDASLQVDGSGAGETASCPHCKGNFGIPLPKATAGSKVPGKLQAVYIMMICIGGLGLLGIPVLVLWTWGILLFWPGTYLAIATTILALVYGIIGINTSHCRIPKFVPILLIVNVINCDVISLTVGVLTLVFLADSDVQAYLEE